MRILNYQRMSTEDGPGLRTTLFVKGCPLSCAWCHNPESISYKSHIEWINVRCIGCKSCIEVCPTGSLSITDLGIFINRDKCLSCGKCIDACPTGALEKKGMDRPVEVIYKDLIKDKEYWGEDGGVTLSGGEILMQSTEAAQLLQMLKKDGVKTAVDTSGFCKKQDIDRVLPYTDLFLYDMKIFDAEKHKYFTGQDNQIIKENLNYLMEQIQDTDKKIWVRTPIIPGATDSEENIIDIARFIAGKVDLWEMCAFNNLCQTKYERLYKSWQYKKTPLMSTKRMDNLVAIAKENGITNVKWSGMTKRED